MGERCYVLGPGNEWIDTFITGTTDSGRSYDTQVEATGGQLMRNCSHIRLRSPDIPMIHASFLQCNLVPSATTDRNALSKRENLVISGPQQLANSQKTVLSGNRKGSIKQTNTSQVLVSETVPDRRVQPSRQAKITTRHSDLREPQLSPSDSHPASSQPVSETTTSESSVSLPSSPLEAQVQRAPVQVTPIVLQLRHHLRAGYSHLRTPQAQRQAVQPVHHSLCHQNCLRWSTLSTPCSQVPEISRGIP